MACGDMSVEVPGRMWIADEQHFLADTEFGDLRACESCNLTKPHTASQQPHKTSRNLTEPHVTEPHKASQFDKSTIRRFDALNHGHLPLTSLTEAKIET
jgi:hypothetical protein